MANFNYVTGSVTGAFIVSTATTVPFALHQTPGAGHLLIAFAGWSSLTATATMSDPNNGTWTPLGSPSRNTPQGFSGQMFYVASSAASATTVTLTISAGVNNAWWEAAEYSYGGTLSVDGTPQYSTVSAVGGVATIAGLTSTLSDDLVWAACIVVDSSATVGTGYTAHNDTNSRDVTNSTSGNDFQGFIGSLLEEKTGVSAGAQVATFGTGLTDQVILGLVAFNGATTSAKVNHNLLMMMGVGT